MSQEVREKLCKNAGSHGLWVGLFPEFSEELLATRELVLALNKEPGFKETIEPTQLHITLSHLGRSSPARRAECAMSAMEMAASLIRDERRISVEGFIRLPNHLGFILAPEQILKLRDQLNLCLADQDIRVDDTFAGIPHMTLGKFRYNSDIARCPFIKPFKLTFRGLAIVSGDARVYAPFSDPGLMF